MTWQLKPESKLGLGLGIDAEGREIDNNNNGKVVDGAAPDFIGVVGGLFDGADDNKEFEDADADADGDGDGFPSEEEDLEFESVK